MLVRLGEESNALVSLVCTTAYESRPHESRLRIVLCLYNFPFRQANSAADVLSTNPGSELRMNAMTCADSKLRLFRQNMLGGGEALAILWTFSFSL